MKKFKTNREKMVHHLRWARKRLLTQKDKFSNGYALIMVTTLALLDVLPYGEEPVYNMVEDRFLIFRFKREETFSEYALRIADEFLEKEEIENEDE